MSRNNEPHYGDNIFGIGSAFANCMRRVGWSRDRINAIHEEAKAGNYDHAIAVYRRFITIRDED